MSDGALTQTGSHMIAILIDMMSANMPDHSLFLQLPCYCSVFEQIEILPECPCRIAPTPTMAISARLQSQSHGNQFLRTHSLRNFRGSHNQRCRKQRVSASQTFCHHSADFRRISQRVGGRQRTQHLSHMRTRVVKGGKALIVAAIGVPVDVTINESGLRFSTSSCAAHIEALASMRCCHRMNMRRVPFSTRICSEDSPQGVAIVAMGARW